MAINYNLNIVTTTPYAVQLTDEVVLVNVPGVSSVVLPAIEPGKNTAFCIKDFSGLAKENPITITSAEGKTIDGVSFAMLNGGYSHIQVVYDGTNWMTIA